MYHFEHSSAGNQRIPVRDNVELGENPIKKDNNKTSNDMIDEFFPAQFINNDMIDENFSVQSDWDDMVDENFPVQSIDQQRDNQQFNQQTSKFQSNVTFTIEPIGTSTVHDYIPVITQPTKKHHIVVDGLNLILGIQSTTNKNSKNYGFMDLRPDHENIQDQHFSGSADLQRVLETAIDFFNVFPQDCTIHLVLKRFGNDMLWEQFLEMKDAYFFDHQKKSPHKYQIWIAKPVHPKDGECDDRFVNLLANYLSTIPGNEVQLLSNDKYRSLGQHWNNRCYFDWYSSDGESMNQYLSKSNFVGKILKCGFNVSIQPEHSRSSWNLVCSLVK